MIRFWENLQRGTSFSGGHHNLFKISWFTIGFGFSEQLLWKMSHNLSDKRGKCKTAPNIHICASNTHRAVTMLWITLQEYLANVSYCEEMNHTCHAETVVTWMIISTSNQHMPGFRIQLLRVLVKLLRVLLKQFYFDKSYW